jgi:hypothetical protein
LISATGQTAPVEPRAYIDPDNRGEVALQARPITIDRVGDENTGAHNSEKRGDCFQHGEDPKAQRLDLTAWAHAQSKEFC